MESNESESVSATKKQQWDLDASYKNEIDIPPELTEALLSNCPPTDTAVGAAKALRDAQIAAIQKAEKHLYHVDQCMALLIKKKKELRQVVQSHVNVVTACDTVLAPIRHIPYDVIQEIARHSMDQYPTGLAYRAPISFARVSSAWRTVILSSPHLWTSLYLTIRPLQVRNFRKYGRLVREWFSRAGRLPLSFHFFIDGAITGPHDTVHFRQFLDIIWPSLTRVRHLGISGQNFIQILNQFIHMPPTLHALERLDCWNRQGGPHNEIIGPISIFQQASLLTTVVMKDAFRSAIIRQSWQKMLPLAQLTHIVMPEKESLRQWIIALECLPRLESGVFSISDLGTSLDRYMNEKNRIHSHLGDLTLEIEYPCPFIGILQIFRLPKLTKLDIKFGGFNDDPYCLRSPIGVKQLGSLQTLALSGRSDFPTQYLQDILCETTDLRTLSLHVLDNADVGVLFRAMTHVNMDSNSAEPWQETIPNIRLPRLTEMHICCPDREPPLEIPDIVAMLRSRCEDVPIDCDPLRKFTLSGLRGVKLFPDLEQKMKELGGIEVEIDLPHHPPSKLEKYPAFGGWMPKLSEHW